MDTTAFSIEYWLNNKMEAAEIFPCCQENNIVDYAIWIEGKLAFTITKNAENEKKWVVSLKNADDIIEDSQVQNIGEAILKHYSG